MAQAENIRSDDGVAELIDSYEFDRRLFDAEVRVRFAHCDALFHAGILNRYETERIKNGLQAILKRAAYDRNYFGELPASNVHAFAEARLVQLVGEVGLKLNVGASRGDYAATVFRLWLREEIEIITNRVRAVQSALVNAAEKQSDAVICGDCGVLKSAPPVLWAHWCLAYFERFARDRERLDEVWRRVNVLPLGSGKSAGTNFEIDREQTARDLKFEGVSLNSLDAISDDDFAVEFVVAAALLMTHLAHLAEDLILYASDDFRLVEFLSNDNVNFSVKQTSALEFIVRGRGRIFGHQMALAAMPRNSRAAFGEDAGEKQRMVFEAADTTKISLQTISTVLEKIRLGEAATNGAAIKNYAAAAAELADYLLHKNVPYPIVRQTIGKILDYAAADRKKINELSLAEMRKFSAHIESDVFAALTLEQALAGKMQIGGTAPERVAEALAAARAALEMEE